MRAILLGILSSFFFAFTFVLNRTMSDSGGSWMWSASLRYLFMIPLLLVIVAGRRKLRGLVQEMRLHPWRWLWWSFIGFGLFYAPLCFSASYSPAWVVAGSWQVTIVAGSLLVPLFHQTMQTSSDLVKARRRIPFRNMGMSIVILAGIGIMEWSQATHVSLHAMLLGMIPVLVAAFAYPLGNRKMMELCEGRLDPYQRILGMTIASLPLWLVLSAVQLSAHGLPSRGQTTQSLMVAVLSGVVATALFFAATDLCRGDVRSLAAVEATQAGEVVFTLVGEVAVIKGTDVSIVGMVGLAFVVIGMVLHSVQVTRSHRVNVTKTNPGLEGISRQDVQD